MHVDPATNELVGELATAWEQTDDRTWRFTLRQGVTFHNGDPFNAEVAAFGINYTWSPENEFEIYQFIGPDMTATAVDDFSVDVQTVEPDPILPARLYFSPIPNMIQVQERRNAALTPREQREVVRGMLREKKLEEAYAAWAQEVRGRAYVEFRDPPQ